MSLRTPNLLDDWIAIYVGGFLIHTMLNGRVACSNSAVEEHLRCVSTHNVPVSSSYNGDGVYDVL
jgi:hypothetical protein